KRPTGSRSCDRPVWRLGATSGSMTSTSSGSISSRASTASGAAGAPAPSPVATSASGPSIDASCDAWSSDSVLSSSAGARPSAAMSDAAAPAPPRGTQIVLAYQSNLLAEYQQCGCAVHPTGGLARRATLLDRARAEAEAVLVLDAGDLLLPAGPLPAATAGGP